VLLCSHSKRLQQKPVEEVLEYITPCPQKGTKKTYENFIIAFELSIVFCFPWQGEQNTMLSSKAIKKFS
jgi:hypothetical protein